MSIWPTGSFALATLEKTPNRPTKFDVFAATSPILDIVDKDCATCVLSYFHNEAAFGARRLFGSHSRHPPLMKRGTGTGKPIVPYPRFRGLLEK